MIDVNDVRQAVELFLQNPYWREYYDGVPTECLKEWVGYQFLLSREAESLEPGSQEEVVAAMKRLEEEFTVEEWEYIYKYTGNNPYKATVQRKIEALREKEE